MHVLINNLRGIKQILTLSFLVPTDQFVVHSFNNDVKCLPCFDWQLFPTPLLISECGDDGHLVQDLYFSIILKEIQYEIFKCEYSSYAEIDLELLTLLLF